MLQIAIVVFREIVEIALILGILTAATKEIPGRSKWILGGLGIGILASIILAAFTNQISESLDGVGQEFFNGLVLLGAAFMIGWTVLWMQKHARSISGELKRLSNSVREGNKPLIVLAVVVLLATLREGIEIVLFCYSYYIAGTPISEIASGLTAGIVMGSALGFAFYLGILKSFGKYFFSITSWLLIFLSCGIAASGIGFWINAEIVPALGNPAIDLSEILPQSSYFGKFLHMFFGYIDQPAGTQLIIYFTILITLSLSLKIAKKM